MAEFIFRSHYCSMALADKCEQLGNDFKGLNPYTHLHNVLLYDAVISWCKIFGSKKEECHWRSVVINEVHFQEYLYSKLSVSKEEYFTYWKSMQEFRNKWVVHFDPSHKHSVVPHFDVAVEAAEALHSYIREYLSDGITYDGPEDISVFGQDVAKAMMLKIKFV